MFQVRPKRASAEPKNRRKAFASFKQTENLTCGRQTTQVPQWPSNIHSLGTRTNKYICPTSFLLLPKTSYQPRIHFPSKQLQTTEISEKQEDFFIKWNLELCRVDEPAVFLQVFALHEWKTGWTHQTDSSETPSPNTGALHKESTSWNSSIVLCQLNGRPP